ncbi:MAG TPA: YraN family protein [Dissulfurispiraceae bacterium]|nr:YraN family protein [Dissulfurispiraceae bacterium]
MKALGPEGEEAAVKYLKARGFKILHRNYKTPLGEADIVALDKDTTVFVEVKARSSSRFGEPFEAVDSRKQERLRRIALFYQKRAGAESAIRFDVISIKDGSERTIDHIEGAF